MIYVLDWYIPDLCNVVLEWEYFNLEGFDVAIFIFSLLIHVLWLDVPSIERPRLDEDMYLLELVLNLLHHLLEWGLYLCLVGGLEGLDLRDGVGLNGIDAYVYVLDGVGGVLQFWHDLTVYVNKTP